MEPTIVIDNGSCNCRVGVGGESAPRAVFQNAVAKIKGDNRVLYGHDIDSSTVINRMNMRRPFDKGYIVNWNLESGIWSRMLESFVHDVQPSDARLLMTEPMFNLASIQQVTQEVVFEHFGFQGMHAVTAPELVMHDHAMSNPDDPVAQSLSGVVVDAGYSFTHAVPIFDGRVNKQGVRRIRVGGKLLTNLMKEWVSYRSMNLKEEPYLVEVVKDALCYVAEDARAESKRAFPKARSQVAMEYVLPDGVSSARGYPRDPRDPAVIEAKQQAAAAAAAAGRAPPPAVLQVNNERFMVPEALFRPQDVGVPQAGVAAATAEALRGIHGALRPLLARSVLLAGGTAACPGFAARFETDLRPQVDDLYNLRVTLPTDPAGAAWRGGSAAAAAGWYSSVLVTKAEYDEYGGGKVRRAAPVG
eukprot:jgi/Ulvmu1/1527/UM011_0257.1